MTPASNWGIGALLGLAGLLLATLAGANVMDWHHVHRVPCECPLAAREFLLGDSQGPCALNAPEGSTLFADAQPGDAARTFFDAPPWMLAQHVMAPLRTPTDPATSR